jgi:hypothetical protein
MTGGAFFLCLLSVLQIYWRCRPPALLKSSIDFVIQLKEKFNGWFLALIKQKMGIGLCPYRTQKPAVVAGLKK